MTWSEIDWPTLDRLRQGFLGPAGSAGRYWTSERDLANYDFTYGERIGWKWDAVLEELRQRGWEPPGGLILDWGCGSGIAGRRVVRAFGPARFDALRVWDQSTVACRFAAAAAAAEFPTLPRAVAGPGLLESDEPIGLLVLSHVLNELDAPARAGLRRLALRARALLWVEPGSREVSRALGGWRDDLADHFAVVAPCTHREACPVLRPGQERHWCHQFAPPPSSIFVDAGWMQFGRQAGIDLRSLPYSFLALDRRPSAAPPPGLSRILGRPEAFKPYVRWLNCAADGLTELTLQKRDDPALAKELARTKAPLVYRWVREGAKVTGGARLGPASPLTPGVAPETTHPLNRHQSHGPTTQ
jgi:hypothetical protein